MSVTFDPRRDRYSVCPQCGPYGIGYGGTYTPQCYSGDCTGGVQCDVRERLRDFYADGVQGGTPLCKNQRTDFQGMNVPFSSYSVNYWGDENAYRQRKYPGCVESDVATFASPNTGVYREPTVIRPVPGVRSGALTIESMAWPGTQSVCTQKI